MPDFPHSILEFQSSFSTERACADYLATLRWPNGEVTCPKCGKPAYPISGRNAWICKNKHQFTLLSKTVMYKSHVSLRKWFWAAYLVSTQGTGISAMTLHRQIDVHYETAYMMLQKLRAGMVDPWQSELQRKVEVDEAFISSGRPIKTRRGRGTSKSVVIVAAEAEMSRTSRVRLRVIPKSTQKYLLSFIKKHVKKGSTILTDGWLGYKNVGNKGYTHKTVTTETPEGIARELFHVHKIFSNLKAWLIGTHHGVSHKHLQAYLNEFAFRYNNRDNPQRAFASVLGISVRTKGPKYEEIYSTGESGGWVHPNPIRRK